MQTAVTNKQQVFERVHSHRSAIELFGAARLGLFGSFVRDEQTPDSDVDFVVEFQEGKKTFRNFMNMADYLEKVLNRKVDLLTWEGMASFVKREVEKEIEYVPFNA
ncbi:MULTISPECIES: nucleotidyltransferase family protein [Spirosoma]|uniref:Nucleotidyltransferase n=1 Tax=Spirosoma sordidisoli TaxID=2502893 RepID=A0A4Q2UEW4_9BACT|nr:MULTISPECIES: nucleotidyltransferase family protein [Spirosoma]RYC67466.1 nucleotidyltransferase [Spirosoma sordidisoli]